MTLFDEVVDYVLHRPDKADQRPSTRACIDHCLQLWPLIAMWRHGNGDDEITKAHTKPAPLENRQGQIHQERNNMKCGIVGLPNVGKSTTFNALTKAGIAAENYPFCTIEPNIGIVEVPDPRLAKLAAIDKPLKVIPAIVEFVDIAGLVAGASKGEGLGKPVSCQYPRTDAIARMVRCFDDPNVIHVSGKVDPLSDIAVIDTELALADMASVERRCTKRKDRAIRRQGKRPSSPRFSSR